MLSYLGAAASFLFSVSITPVWFFRSNIIVTLGDAAVGFILVFPLLGLLVAIPSLEYSKAIPNVRRMLVVCIWNNLVWESSIFIMCARWMGWF